MSSNLVKPAEPPAKDAQPQTENSHKERRVAIPVRVPDDGTVRVKTNIEPPKDLLTLVTRRIPRR